MLTLSYLSNTGKQNHNSLPKHLTMREKINKITVSTRITIPLRDILEQEAEKEGLSFCSYLEQLILERNKGTKDDFSLDEKQLYTLPDYNPKSKEEDITTLKNQLIKLKETFLNYQKKSIAKQKEVESEISDLEDENYDLTKSIKELRNEIVLLQQDDFESESLSFLKEQFPDLSRATIINNCLECCAKNEKQWLFLYRISDFLR